MKYPKVQLTTRLKVLVLIELVLIGFVVWWVSGVMSHGL